jgi:hypothetical protein
MMRKSRPWHTRRTIGFSLTEDMIAKFTAISKSRKKDRHEMLAELIDDWGKGTITQYVITLEHNAAWKAERISAALGYLNGEEWIRESITQGVKETYESMRSSRLL